MNHTFTFASDGPETPAIALENAGLVASLTDAQQRQAQLREEEEAAEALSRRLRVPLVKLAALTLDPEALKYVPEASARKYLSVPIKLEQPDASEPKAGRPILVLAMANATDFNAVSELEFSTGCKISPLVATKTEVQDAIERYYAPENLLNDLLRNIADTPQIKVLEETSNQQSAGDDSKEAPAIKLVNLILQHAIQKGASDVHLEPSLYDLKVRIRVGGVLESFTTFPKWLQDPITSRIKIMAKLNITEHRRAQDGRIKLLLDDRDIDLRISTLPTHFGEKTVLRVLGTSQKLPRTQNLGLRAKDLEMLQRAAGQPQGMIVVTGPTGSGKTTTLYSVLHEKVSPSINIVTIEDPIEIQLAGLNQVQVNEITGMTFASCMRSLLRQDPDVILLGEIRDRETQAIAMQAAQTGHLVMTTLHANSTSATISRLQDLGAEPYLIAGAVNMLVAQRLLRRICNSCKESYKPSTELLLRFGLQFHDIPLVRGKGCASCAYTGYEGRYAIYELLPVTQTIKQLILRRAAESEIRQAAISEGMSPLLDQAIEHIKDGLTTCEEVARVIEVEQTADLGGKCPKCSEAVSSSFVRCPYCCTELKRTCSSCRQELAMEWSLCPYCGVSHSRAQQPTLVLANSQPRPAVVGFMQPAASAPVLVPQSAVPKRERSNTILVVDDVDTNRLIAVKALQKLPFQPEILEAKDGFEALEIMQSHKPDLILLDLMMPGMSGFEVCRKVRENLETAFIPIILLTASTSEQHRVEGYLTGTDDYVTKPFSVADLHARVNRAFRRTYGI
ncbi:MAG: Flp pilus assembly complex ATPase component TadA [Acidobacteria bacterium]|nr:Flp pilus assembly complex ATPase component TadA [Acidobacteriota bacterium]MBV9146767.1 Flp pilus assembly complex ATPase component TadA [Acidobacteriota bacterium]